MGELKNREKRGSENNFSKSINGKINGGINGKKLMGSVTNENYLQYLMIIQCRAPFLFLLQKIEAFDGVVILVSNLPENIDD